VERGKNNPGLTFADVLGHLHEAFYRVDASFSARLLHTLQPDMPTWDLHIGQNTGIRIPAYHSRDQIATAVKRYGELARWFAAYRDSPDGTALLRLFDTRFPASGISDIKKIDLVLCRRAEQLLLIMDGLSVTKLSSVCRMFGVPPNIRFFMPVRLPLGAAFSK
jgi:hypothetical protein